MNNRRVCLTVLEAGTKIKVLVDSVSGEDLLPGPLMTIISLCPPMARRGEGALWGVCYQGPNPIPKGPTLMTKSPLNAPPPNALTLGLSFIQQKKL